MMLVNLPINLEYIEDTIKYLTAVKRSMLSGYVSLYLRDEAWEGTREAFSRLSTCMESCGCTGYSPKDSCPDPKCFCNTDKEN